MREKNLIKLGFKKQILDDKDYYYTFNIPDVDSSYSICLISNSSDQVKKSNDWFVEIFDYTIIRITKFIELKKLIKILKNNEFRKIN